MCNHILFDFIGTTCTKSHKRSRSSFSHKQLVELERRFNIQRYSNVHQLSIQSQNSCLITPNNRSIATNTKLIKRGMLQQYYKLMSQVKINTCSDSNCPFLLIFRENIIMVKLRHALSRALPNPNNVIDMFFHRTTLLAESILQCISIRQYIFHINPLICGAYRTTVG